MLVKNRRFTCTEVILRAHTAAVTRLFHWSVVFHVVQWHSVFSWFAQALLLPNGPLVAVRCILPSWEAGWHTVVDTLPFPKTDFTISTHSCIIIHSPDRRRVDSVSTGTTETLITRTYKISLLTVTSGAVVIPVLWRFSTRETHCLWGSLTHATSTCTITTLSLELFALINCRHVHGSHD